MIDEIAQLRKEIGQLLLEKKWTISTMESCTGGGIVNELIKVSGASNYVKGGLVTYTNEIKMNLGHIPSQLIEEYTELSSECAIAMAENAKELFATDIALSSTGMLENGEEDGFAYIAISTQKENKVIKEKISGNRENNLNYCIFVALSFLKRSLNRVNDEK